MYNICIEYIMVVYNFDDDDNAKPCFNTVSTKSMYSRRALSPIRPMRNIWPAVGPKPPAISNECLFGENKNKDFENF